ncbi:MAG: hypothetical protein IPN09_06305 [Bacteroidetes bacterium]|nr:hypothetical protein [Bacteroidota bacterium]
MEETVQNLVSDIKNVASCTIHVWYQAFQEMKNKKCKRQTQILTFYVDAMFYRVKDAAEGLLAFKEEKRKAVGKVNSRQFVSPLSAEKDMKWREVNNKNKTTDYRL